MKQPDAILKATGLIIILLSANCLFTQSANIPVNNKPAVLEESPEVSPEPSLPPPAPTKPTKISPDSPLEVIYQDIIQKISEAHYLPALKEIDQIINKYTSPQPYIIEAQIIRLIILAANRAAYLHLADTYHQGWETVLNMPDESLPTEERLTRLANFSNISISYYQKHKETSAKLLKSYDILSQLPADSLKERLRIIGLQFRNPIIIPNILLEAIKSGELPTTAKREEAKNTEVHNCILTFWTALAGLKTPEEVNQLLAKGSYALDQKGFYAWLIGSFQYQVKEARAEAFGDKPELRKIFLSKVEKFLSTLNKLLESEPPEKPPFQSEQFDPQILLPEQ